jgi:hypothetical protein
VLHEVGQRVELLRDVERDAHGPLDGALFDLRGGADVEEDPAFVPDELGGRLRGDGLDATFADLGEFFFFFEQGFWMVFPRREEGGRREGGKGVKEKRKIERRETEVERTKEIRSDQTQKLFVSFFLRSNDPHT